jgi:7-keto-8-aminopelargonate synthetase-like enzyme
MMMVDDAHGTGVLGKKGKGTAEQLAVSAEDITIQMGTLGKALGTYGAYVAGSRELIDYLINKVRPFIYSTALPPNVAAAAIAAIDIVEEEPELRTALNGNAQFMRNGLRELGFDTMGSETQIIPVLVGDSGKAIAMMDNLLEEGVFAQAIRPPTVPEGTARIRVTVMANHTLEDLNRALAAFKKVGAMTGVI